MDKYPIVATLYTHVATCRLAPYICVYMVPVKCEKYSVKSEILGENS